MAPGASCSSGAAGPSDVLDEGRVSFVARVAVQNCTDPVMMLSFLYLSVIPELKLMDKG